MAKSKLAKSKNQVEQWVAFLQGINVGGRTAKSPQLIEAFSKLKLANVATFLASGNVIFDTEKQSRDNLKSSIEKGVASHLGFASEVFLRSMEEVKAIAKLNPFQLNDHEQANFTVNVILLGSAASKVAQDKVDLLKSDYDDFHFDESQLYWLCRGKKITDSPLFDGNRLAKSLPKSTTTRNLRTMERLVAKFGQ